MTLATTIEVNDGGVSTTGIVIALMPGSDPTVPIELWRAADLAGAPDSANAVMVVAQIIRPGGLNYVDVLPTNGTIYWYRSRTNGNAYGAGPYTDWVNLGAADRLIRDAVVALGDSDAVKNSAAWAAQVARMGPQVQNILPNAGFEDGLAFWKPNAFVDNTSFTVVNNAANAKGGNQYLKVTSTTGVRTNVVVGDDTGKKRWFEVNPGDLIQWGGWVYRESGTDNCQVLMQTGDKDQASVSNYVAGPNNTAGWVFVQGQQVIPASGVKYVTLFCDCEGNGTATVARFDDVYLRIGLGALSDVPAPNTRYQMRFSSGIADPDGVDGMQSYIDFPATTNFMRVGQVPFAISSSTLATPIAVTTSSNHGYSTGDTVTIRGHATNTAANGTWTITVTGAATFTLNTSVGNGTGGATGHVVRLALVITGAGLLTIFSDGPATFRNQIVFGPISGPATPPAGFVEMYSKTGQTPSALYWKDDAGTEFVVGMRIVARDVFTANGTWTKPSSATIVWAHVWGAGGSGGSGRADVATGVNAGGGSGGGGGCYNAGIFRAADLTATVAITVAGGTTGAVGVAPTANGNQGTSGGASSFGAYLRAGGGGSGAGGVAATAQAGGSGGGVFGNGQGGGTGSTPFTPPLNTSEAGAGCTTGGDGSPAGNGGGSGGGVAVGSASSAEGGCAVKGAGGGGGGGGMNTTTVKPGYEGGASGRLSGTNQPHGGGGTAGAINGGAGGNGADALTEYASGDGGGGGGGANSSVPGAGGNGGIPGGGGGGGGARNNGGAGNSGAGGNGARGQVTVYSLG